MKNNRFITLIASTLVYISLSSCAENTSETSNKMLAGQESLLTNCSACHNLPNQNRTGIAPPFSHIKEAYQAQTEKEFTQSIVSFLNNPTLESAKMKNAVENHGLMPKMSFSEKELEKISHYLYHSDLENFNLLSGEVIETEDTLNYLEEGKKLALQTKSILGKNLMMSVKEKGPAGAVEFCNERAIHLTDSMAQELNAKIKRVTDKPRNANNRANETELDYIAELKLGNNKKGITREVNNKIIGYYPIETNDMCMKCHGDKEKQINQKTHLKISELYPQDEATGYSPNQIRGIWVVEMDKK